MDTFDVDDARKTANNELRAVAPWASGTLLAALDRIEELEAERGKIASDGIGCQFQLCLEADKRRAAEAKLHLAEQESTAFFRDAKAAEARVKELEVQADAAIKNQAFERARADQNAKAFEQAEARCVVLANALQNIAGHVRFSNDDSPERYLARKALANPDPAVSHLLDEMKKALSAWRKIAKEGP